MNFTPNTKEQLIDVINMYITPTDKPQIVK